MSIGSPALIASGASSVAGNHTLTLIDSVAATEYVITDIAVDNSGGGGAAPSLSVSDSKGNTYTVVGPANADPGAASAGATVYTAYAKVTTPLAIGDTITFTLGSNPTAKAAYAHKVSGIHQTAPVAVAVATDTGTVTNDLSISRTPLAAGQLVWGATAIEGRSMTITADSDTTDGSWSAVAAVSTADLVTETNNQTVYGQHKIVTGTTAQTWNPTLSANRDWAGLLLVFAVAPVVLAGSSDAAASSRGPLDASRPLTGKSVGAVSMRAPVVLASALNGSTRQASTIRALLALAELFDGGVDAAVDTRGSVLLDRSLLSHMDAAGSAEAAAILDLAFDGRIVSAATVHAESVLSIGLDGRLDSASLVSAAVELLVELSGGTSNALSSSAASSVQRDLSGSVAGAVDSIAVLGVLRDVGGSVSAAMSALSSMSADRGMSTIVSAAALLVAALDVVGGAGESGSIDAAVLVVGSLSIDRALVSLSDAAASVLLSAVLDVSDQLVLSGVVAVCAAARGRLRVVVARQLGGNEPPTSMLGRERPSNITGREPTTTVFL